MQLRVQVVVAAVRVQQEAMARLAPVARAETANTTATSLAHPSAQVATSVVAVAAGDTILAAQADRAAEEQVGAARGQAPVAQPTPAGAAARDRTTTAAMVAAEL